MEPSVARSRGRPRKRRREDTRNGEISDDCNRKGDMEGMVENRKKGRLPRKRPIEIRGQVMVGRYVMKEFEGSGIFVGKIVFYDSGLYRVEYEDGDCEDLDSGELREYLIADESELFVGNLLEKKKKLDEHISKKMGVKLNDEPEKGDSVKLVDELEGGNLQNDARKLEVPTSSELSGGEVNGSEVDDDDDDDSSSDSCQYGQGWETRSETEAPPVPPPELPPSSGSIGVPEEYVSHLFSTYGFLRSFSIRLFLSPFTLDDLVGCLNCTVPSTLLDSIHVALLRALRRHLETLASEGSELASKCLRCIDWGLLDMLTWPVYLVRYLMVMGRLSRDELNGFYSNVLVKDYFTLSVGIKLTVLQILCDDALDTAEIREEIDFCKRSEVGPDSDEFTSLESEPRKVYPRYCKISVGRDRENTNMDTENILSSSSNSLTMKGNDCKKDAANVDEDANGDECRLCGMDGMLLCCDGCPSAYHSRCIGVNKLSIPEGEWFCPECTINRIGPAITAGSSLKEAQVFGVDSYAQLFLGTCDHLLVLKVSVKASPFVRYYNRNNIVKVITLLCSSPHHAVIYLGICQAILRYWELPQNVIPPLVNSQTSMALENRAENVVLPMQVLPFCDNGSHNVLHKVEHENYASSLGESIVDNNVSRSSIEKFNVKPSSIDVSLRNSMLYMGSFFKPHAYINYFTHGELAASAAANFALSSGDNRASEVCASDPRKVMAANVTLQGKAFSSAAVRFFWPSLEKKLIEVPRERCSWCCHCKAPVTSKKACLLNQAALNAARAAMKFISGHKLTKNVEGGLYSIATYTLYMEESLRGLILGPFQSESYRQQWCKKVQQASTYNDMKSLLLEFEGNLSTIALSSEWTKLVDSWMDEPSVPQSACPTGSTQKRGPGRRKKHLAAAEATSDDSKGSLKHISWWRGGKQAKLVFQRAILPASVLKKAARHGGSRRIPAIYYADSCHIPKRTRQFIWRAAVEMARNASQLALQVRYLDHHIKWNDLVRPEQTVQDGKGPETEASAFRNSLICDKKVVENKTIYGVTFRHQKNLSSRLMKSIIEKEDSQDGKDKYWFPETRVPLYLIKGYEENAAKTFWPPPNEPSKELPPLSKLQQEQVKASRKNIFCYLACKRENLCMCLCASCHRDVVIKDTATTTCSVCEGYCHQECTMSSTVLTDEDVEFRITCKQCLHGKVVTQNYRSAESPTSPLPFQGQKFQNSAIVSKSARPKSTGQNSAAVSKRAKPKRNSQQLPSIATSETPSYKEPASSDSNVTKNKKGSRHWGLIWKKKDTDRDGSGFWVTNILSRGNLHDVNALSPICYLCKKPYNHDLVYICCEACKRWYHAEAVELDESRLPDLLGFKCCRCRRIKTPVCPYSDLNAKMVVKRLHIRGPKQDSVPAATSVSESISEQVESIPSTPISPMEEDILIEVDDPLLEPKAVVEFDWNTPSGPGPQKLQVRRHVKNEKDDDVFTSNPSLVQFPTYVDNENTDYEPHTYFSFTELLEADEGNQFGVGASSGGVWEMLPSEISRSGVMEQFEMGSTIDDVPMESMETVINPTCKICLQTEPDLACQNCGLQIHGDCSPWQEFSLGEKSWSCGNCRQCKAWC